MDKQFYQLQIKNEKLIYYNRLGLFILLIHILYFSYLLVRLLGSSIQYPVSSIPFPISFLFVSLGGLILNRHSLRENKNPPLPFPLLFFVLGCLWMGMGMNLFGSALFTLMTLEFIMREKLMVQISSECVIIPSFFKRIIQWNELNNVILKDGIITIDYKNDHLFQASIKEEEPVDEMEFNSFCLKLLS